MAPSRLLTGAAGRYLELVDRIAPAADALQPAERLASVEVADTAGGRAKLPDSLDSADMEAHSLSPGLTHEVLNTSITAAEAEFFKCIQQDPAQVAAELLQRARERGTFQQNATLQKVFADVTLSHALEPAAATPSASVPEVSRYRPPSARSHAASRSPKTPAAARASATAASAGAGATSSPASLAATAALPTAALTLLADRLDVRTLLSCLAVSRCWRTAILSARSLHLTATTSAAAAARTPAASLGDVDPLTTLMAPLDRFPHLRSLTVHGHRERVMTALSFAVATSGSGISGGTALALTHLDLGHVPGLSDDALVRLMPGLPRLVHLRLPASAVSDRSLRTMCTHLPALASLNLDLDAEGSGAAGVSDPCVSLIAALLPRLRVLGLCGSGVRDGGLMALAGGGAAGEAMTALEEVRLEHCPGVSDVGLGALAGGCTALRRVVLGHNGARVTARGRRLLHAVGVHLENAGDTGS